MIYIYLQKKDTIKYYSVKKKRIFFFFFIILVKCKRTHMVERVESNIQYEDLGVFLGFIKYPYHVDGKDLYQKTFEPFFKNHKKRISKYDTDALTGDDPYPNIYTPAGYRMFGSSGLAILSLVDDYSFYSRFFSISHIRTVHTEEGKDKVCEEMTPSYENIKSVVISGVTEKDEKDSLEDIAKRTFLRTENRYPYIGIIRLKIDYRLLAGRGNAIKVVTKIKEKIRELSGQYCDKKFDYLAMDCYDNDEMTVIAFANELQFLYDFLGDIRSLKDTTIQEKLQNKVERHYFGMTYLGFGYDLYSSEYEFLDDNCHRLNCVVETKPGHRDAFYDYLQSGCPESCPKYEKSGCQLLRRLGINEIKNLGINRIDLNISGGCSLYFSMPLKKIGGLEMMCRDCSTIHRDVREIKISLKDFESETRHWASVSDNHVNHEGDKNNRKVDDERVEELRDIMKRVGISKMVRDRLLALIEFYNYSCQNILQSFYLKELKPALDGFINLIIETEKDSEKNPDTSTIKDIEKILNKEISDLEDACYDRLHVHKYNTAPLEYRGGIQQYLTSFDFAYKQIHKVFAPDEDNAVYVTITGAERASSTRRLFRLNIHDIVYPELYVASVWKEVANFALLIQERLCYNEEELIEKNIELDNYKESVSVLNIWNSFVFDNKSFNVIIDKIRKSDALLLNDDVCDWVLRNVNQELMEYYMMDYIVFHFAFSENYSLMWHFYFKILFQTTQGYRRLNHIYKRNFINMLLRLFMVAEIAGHSKDNEENGLKIKKFLDSKCCEPFDSIAASQWLECYNKVRAATVEIYNVIQCYGFQGAVEDMCKYMEWNIYKKENPGDSNKLLDVKFVHSILYNREEQIVKSCDDLLKGCLITEVKGEFSFLILLWGAYLRAVYGLDYEAADSELAIKCMPRDSNGKISSVMDIKVGEENEIYNNMIRIPVDTTGGFFVPSANTRRKYFSLRTAFYRSLWNYCFMYQEGT